MVWLCVVELVVVVALVVGALIVVIMVEEAIVMLVLDLITDLRPSTSLSSAQRSHMSSSDPSIHWLCPSHFLDQSRHV